MPLRVEHVQKRRQPLAVTVAREFERALLGFDRIVERGRARLVGAVHRQRVVDVAQRHQHGLPVCERGFRLTRLRQAQVRHQLTARKDRQRHRRPERIEQVRPVRELAHVRGAQPDLTGQRDIRIELRDRHADVGRRRMQVGFRAADVGPPARERRRQADRHDGRHLRQCMRRGEPVVERARRAAHQIGERIAQQHDLLIELRQLRADLRKPCVGTAHVEVAREAVRRLLSREVEQIALRALQLVGQLALAFGAAQLQIGLRDFGLERQQRVVAARDRGARLRVGRLDRTAHTPEQVELP
ncbi:hypothetical protein WI97_02835 [Burkholderia vietnamiensis]|nr:hypothetical protein WI97_02835 [Burkholderia vietnamiensis]